MTEHDDHRLAPVTPIFGGPAPAAPAEEPAAGDETGPSPTVPRRTGDEGIWRSTWHDAPARHDDDAGVRALSPRHPAGSSREGGRAAVRPLRALHPHAGDGEADAPREEVVAEAEVRAAAEERLVRKLRTRALSISEARGVLREQGLSAEAIDEIVDDFCRRSYLDDRALADHLVTSGSQRKGQGRVALKRALAQRGLPRDVIDAALEELPDDDADRALEFARTKARQMTRLDHETALRRLVGQLARRGFTGSAAMDAARTALRDEGIGGAPRSGVRFEPS